MSPPQQRLDSTEVLSDEDLRELARRHAKLLHRFLRERERGRTYREADVKTCSPMQNMAEAILYRQSVETEEKAGAEKPEVPSSAGTLTQKVEGAMHFKAPPKISEAAKLWKKIGGFGLSFSLIFHLALIIVAIFWVVAVSVEPPEAPPEFFATGSGGGRGGAHPSYADVQSERRKNVKIAAGTRSRKIVSKVAKSNFVLPELPSTAMAHAFSGNDMILGGSLNAGGNLSSGSGGGLGGGIGTGTGIGIGNARNFISKFQSTQKILGTDVTASRLAVYMDSSGSMTEVLPVVREEILKKFPTADVYEFMGCGMVELSEKKRSRYEEISWISKKKSLLRKYESEKKPSVARRAAKDRKKTNKTRDGFGFQGNSDWRKNLSSYGKALLSEWGGTDYYSWLPLGTWLDMVFTEGGYDAVIVFADFQDYRDGQLDNEAKIFDCWLNHARENGQRAYFFTTEMLPQNIFRALAEHTGGNVAIPRDISKNSETAKLTDYTLRRQKVKKQPDNAAAALSSVENAIEADEDIEEIPAEETDAEDVLELDDED